MIGELPTGNGNLNSRSSAAKICVLRSVKFAYYVQIQVHADYGPPRPRWSGGTFHLLTSNDLPSNTKPMIDFACVLIGRYSPYPTPHVTRQNRPESIVGTRASCYRITSLSRRATPGPSRPENAEWRRVVV